jgi:hypothetical protein
VSFVHATPRRRFIPWEYEWHSFTVEEVEALVSGFAAVEMGFTGFTAAFGRSERQR